MADLQPLGSEKLQGMDKIQRILEIARFKENIPTPVNETSKGEYSVTLADGNEYQIVREKTGYIIKKTISESTTDYMEPIQNRKYFTSYSQALKKLNLMAKEMNEMFENEEGQSLFSEQKKFVLKTPRPEKKNPDVNAEVENVPAPPAPMTPPAPPADLSTPPTTDVEGELPPPPPSDEEGDIPPPPSDEDMDFGGEEPEGEEGDDEVVTFKTIQKLTGKLGQKLRTYNSNEEEQMSSKDIKYVINSILSALDLQNLDEDDLEDIMNKLEGTEEEFDSEKFDVDTDVEGEEEGEEEGSDEEMSSEMGENWDALGQDIAIKTMSKAMTPGQFTEEDDDVSHLNTIADSMFMESKVEDILTKYFVITESEKRFNQEINAKRKIVNKVKVKELSSEIKRLSENVEQEVSARKFLKENTNAKLIGKTNKKNLVFEMNNKQYKVSTNGEIL